MNRYELTVRRGSIPNRLLSYLKSEWPLIPEKAFRDALKDRDILLNGRRINDNCAIVEGDQIVVFTIIAPYEIPVIFEDESYVIVNKPAGLNSDDNERSAFSLAGYLRQRYEGMNKPLLCHRLDNQTSGLLLAAKNEPAMICARESFKSRKIVKKYQCIVVGQPKPESAVLEAYLIKDAQLAKVFISGSYRKEAKKIVTEYETMEKGDLTRLKITLHTGRTHQIRAHLAFLGYPILGDDLYGNRDENKIRKARTLKLCATELIFPQDCDMPGLRGMRFVISAPF